MKDTLHFKENALLYMVFFFNESLLYMKSVVGSRKCKEHMYFQELIMNAMGPLNSQEIGLDSHNISFCYETCPIRLTCRIGFLVFFSLGF